MRCDINISVIRKKDNFHSSRVEIKNVQGTRQVEKAIEIENIAMGHDAVALAAVVGIAHPKWDERPILLCQLKSGESASADDLTAYLDGKIAKWWMPDDVLFVDEIPLGATGKIDKRAIRASLTGYELPFEVSR